MFHSVAEADSDEEDKNEDVGGLFKVIKPSKDDKKKLRKGMNDLDCSSFSVDHVRDWTLEEVGVDFHKDPFEGHFEHYTIIEGLQEEIKKGN